MIAVAPAKGPLQNPAYRSTLAWNFSSGKKFAIKFLPTCACPPLRDRGD